MERILKEILREEQKRNSLLADISKSLKVIANKVNLSSEICVDGIREAVLLAKENAYEEQSKKTY